MLFSAILLHVLRGIQTHASCSGLHVGVGFERGKNLKVTLLTLLTTTVRMSDYADGVSKNPVRRQSGQGAEDTQGAKNLASDTGDDPDHRAELDNLEVATQDSLGAQAAHGRETGAGVSYTHAQQVEGDGSLRKGHGCEEEAGQSRNSAMKEKHHWIQIETRPQHSTDCGLPAFQRPPPLHQSLLVQNSCR